MNATNAQERSNLDTIAEETLNVQGFQKGILEGNETQENESTKLNLIVNEIAGFSSEVAKVGGKLTPEEEEADSYIIDPTGMDNRRETNIEIEKSSVQPAEFPGNSKQTSSTEGNQNRNKFNRIDLLKNGKGCWLENSTDIAACLASHFKTIFMSGNENEFESITSLLPVCINDRHNNALIAVPSFEEVRLVDFDMPSNKSPGPDGFPSDFYKLNWDIVAEDIVNMVGAFFSTAFLCNNTNDTFISLIPKIKARYTPADFRPISLCNTSYKILSKLLSNRLKPFLNQIVSPFQSAFIPGRQITDNVIISHEVIHSMKRKKGKTGVMGIKLDMSKAFDRVSWNYLIAVMSKLGFNNHWCLLIYNCISSVTSQVLLNGVPGEKFSPRRGLRQGDPLSPYLFLLCMEGLSRFLREAESLNNFHGIKVARTSLSITHLLFADDCLIFMRATVREGKKLLSILSDFGNTTGQLINLDKSGIFFSKNTPKKMSRKITSTLKVRHLSLDEKYLGIPMFTHRSKAQCFQPIIDKVRAKLQGWKMKKLSQAGRAVMVKTVMETMSNYQMNCFLIPISTTEEISNLQRDFWWGKHDNRGIFLKSWNSFCKNKNRGGLGFKNLNKMNLALISRVGWRLLHEKDCLWVQILKSKYFPYTCPLISTVHDGSSWLWKCMKKGLQEIHKFGLWIIGDGAQIHITSHKWIPNLAVPKFSLHALDDLPSISVASFFKQDTREWDVDILNNCCDLETMNCIRQIRVSRDGVDHLNWTPSASGSFYVKSLYEALTDNTNNSQFSPPPAIHDNIWDKVWGMKVIPRVKNFIWKAIHDILPVSARIYSTLNYIDPTCKVCGHDNETVMHLLFYCEFARCVWFGLNCGIRTEHVFINNFNVWFVSWFDQGAEMTNPYQNEFIEWNCFFALVCWHLWKARCSLIFEGKVLNPLGTIIMIQNDFLHQIAVQEKQARTSFNNTQGSTQNTHTSVHYPKEKSPNNLSAQPSISGGISRANFPNPNPNPKHNLSYSYNYNPTTSTMGIGMTISDNAGNLSATRSSSTYCITEEEGKLKAALQALKWWEQQKLTGISLITKDNNIIKLFKERHSSINEVGFGDDHSKMVFGYLEEIKKLLSDFARKL